jgi:hypothetical protein
MSKIPDSLLRKWQVLGVAAAGAVMGSCTQVGDTWMLGSMSAAAHDQIMLVRKDPPSFGYQRLATQTVLYPDLGLFVTQHGLPNFLAETGNSDRRYFILYYLAERKAFACRTRTPNTHSVEFAGPYPITDREYRLLDNFRKDPSRQPAKF